MMDYSVYSAAGTNEKLNRTRQTKLTYKLRGLSPRANYTNRATAASRRS
jgi:hypothetical protein